MLLSLDRPSPIGLWYKINLSSGQGVPKKETVVETFKKYLEISDTRWLIKF